jgi:manganese/iron transport system ATP-binding protein
VTYRNGHTALRNASFSVPGGSIAALVGVNGSGSSGAAPDEAAAH